MLRQDSNPKIGGTNVSVLLSQAGPWELSIIPAPIPLVPSSYSSLAPWHACNIRAPATEPENEPTAGSRLAYARARSRIYYYVRTCCRLAVQKHHPRSCPLRFPGCVFISRAKFHARYSYRPVSSICRGLPRSLGRSQLCQRSTSVLSACNVPDGGLTALGLGADLTGLHPGSVVTGNRVVRVSYPVPRTTGLMEPGMNTSKQAHWSVKGAYR